MNLRASIETYLKATGIPASRFGREAARDPQLVHDLRRGREIGPKLGARLLAYMARGQ